MKKQKFYLWRVLSLAILILTITSCGFKMREKTSLPPKLQQIYLQTAAPYQQFSLGLKQNFVASGIKILPHPNSAAMTLEVSAPNFTHNNANTYSSAQASVYNFVYSVNLKLQNGAGEPVFGPIAVTLNRHLTLNPNEILEVSNQVDHLKQEMQREVIMKIMLILNSDQIAAALSSPALK